MASVDLSAGPLHYRESGPADGPAVVFVHGFLVDHSLWADVPERLAGHGFHCLAPTWPLGAHRTAMHPGANLSPRGLARLVATFIEALDLQDVVLVGNDTGGAICQLLLDEDASRVGRLVLTNCDAFESFPPAPFDTMFRLARSPRAGLVMLQPLRLGLLRTGRLGFGNLTRRPLTATETQPWVTSYLSDAGVRRGRGDVRPGVDRARAHGVGGLAGRVRASGARRVGRP